jgi:hypothetical protein
VSPRAALIRLANQLSSECDQVRITERLGVRTAVKIAPQNPTGMVSFPGFLRLFLTTRNPIISATYSGPIAFQVPVG